MPASWPSSDFKPTNGAAAEPIPPKPTNQLPHQWGWRRLPLPLPPTNPAQRQPGPADPPAGQTSRPPNHRANRWHPKAHRHRPAAAGPANLDTIINFQNAASILPIASDQLWLDDDNFRSLATENGTLGATSFASNGGGTPTAAAAQITYDSNVGLLAYDPDGTGALGAVAFAKFEGNPLITTTDIRLF